MLYYSSKVIESTRTFDSRGAMLAISALPMLVKLIATAIATFGIVDQLGLRRPLMAGMGAMDEVGAMGERGEAAPAATAPA